MSTDENEIDEILFNHDDADEACIGSVMVIRKGCAITSKMSLIDLIKSGLAEVITDIENPEESSTPADCKEMAAYAHEAFAEGKAVTISLTIMPEDVLMSRADAHDADVAVEGDDGRLLN